MKIVNKGAGRQASPNTFWLLFGAGALAVGLLLGNAGVLSRLHDSFQRLQRYLTAGTPSNTLPVWTVDIPFETYNQELLQQRETALEKGMLLSREAAYVNSDIRLPTGVVPISLRLQPGLARHLGPDEKWNYELLTRGDELLSELSRTNLIDPADNNWLMEWAFLEALRMEGLPVPRYEFVNLVINGENKGLYALQERPSPLIESPDGLQSRVVLTYDTDPLLEAVSYYGDVGLAAADPVSNLATNDPRFLQVRDIDDPLVTDDEILSDQAQRATALLRGLQSGELAASEVFDSQAYGRFLALVDLWGAESALSPFNIHYVYDPQNDRLQPIAVNANPIQAESRLPDTAMYNDPAIQMAYAAAVAEFSDPAYLSRLRESIETDYLALERALPSEAATVAIWDALAERQEQLRLSLRPAQPVIAQLGSPDLVQQAIIRINVANTLNLPQEIHGFDIDGATFLEASPDWIVDGESAVDIVDNRVILKPLVPEQAGLQFVSFDLPLTRIINQDQELNFLNEIVIQVATSIRGLDTIQLTSASPGLPDSN